MTAVGAPVPRATVLSLRDVRFADARAVGGKAASLGELLAAGIRVPDGVVLTTDVAAMAAVDGQEFLQDVLAKLGTARLPFALVESPRTARGIRMLACSNPRSTCRRASLAKQSIERSRAREQHASPRTGAKATTPRWPSSSSGWLSPRRPA